MNPKVSVIVPIYNVEKYIERCVRSLFEQTLDEIEYIFVNDATPDNSIVLLNKIAKEYPNRLLNIRIINHINNTGQSGAREDGMAIATGDYIIHCDADDWVDLDMYENMYNAAIQHQCDAVCCDMAIEYPNYTEIRNYDNQYDDHQLMIDCLAPIDVVYFSMCNRLISRKIFEQHDVKPFKDVNMWDDVGLTIRLRYYIQHCFIINKAFYHYNKSNESSTTQRPILDRVKEQIKCIQKIEEFFILEKDKYKYRYFITYLKLKSKEETYFDNTNFWIRTFPECKYHLWYMRKLYPFYIWKHYFLASYIGIVGKQILDFYTKVHLSLKNKMTKFY